MTFGGTSCVTTLPAPTIAFSPITSLERMVDPEPIDAPRLTTVFSTDQSLSVCSCGPGIRIVNKRHSVAHKNVVFNGYPFAHEGVARDLAASSHSRILLDLYEGADLRFIANIAPVEIDEFRELHATTEPDIRCNGTELAHSRISSPLFWIDASAASSIRTTRRPA
jgi:hypothetical protein